MTCGRAPQTCKKGKERTQWHITHGHEPCKTKTNKTKI